MPDSLHDEPMKCSDALFETGGCSMRRIRHITSIQVRNLTPFPVRDAFASALLQPSEQPQFTAYGHLSDDLDLTISRRRSRRISSHSLSTLRSTKLEDGTKGEDVQGPSTGSPEHRGRLRAASRISFSSAGSLGPSASAGTSSRTFPTTGVTSTIRASNRPRTSSTASSVNSNIHPSAILHSSSTGSVSLSAMLPDNSQKGLEKVIKSRLVETFISITIPPSPLKTGPFNETHLDTVPPRSRPSTPPHTTSPLREKLAQRNSVPFNKSPTRNSKVDSPSVSNAPRGSPFKRRDTPTSRTITQTKSSTLARSTQPVPARLNGKTPNPSLGLSRKLSNLNHTHPPSPTTQILTPTPTLPNFFSPIHRPSTNPSFAIDARSRCEFAQWTDTSGEKLKIDIWGKVEVGWPGAENGSGTSKGKEKERLGDGHGRPEWKVLEQWSVNLTDLVPLPDDLTLHPSHLLSNTLLISLAPHGQIHCLPSSFPLSRPPSSAGYNSDPEAGVRDVESAGELVFPASSRGFADNKGDASYDARKRWSRWRSGTVALSSQEGAKTAGWQDLLKLVTLQACILDTEESLSRIIQEIDKILEGDVVGVLKREASERETFVGELRLQSDQVMATSADLRHRIAARREQLQNRKETLAFAKEQLSEDAYEESELEQEVLGARNLLSTLRSHLLPTRTMLITTLSAIFPIDLLSPPDLLYTILSVPLPIPLSSTDPGPPLSLSNHREVTEDAVATALGYAAQVVQLLAAYLGKGLVYPITCVGSRSLVRDSISAMVGPRMFPLFSKGVDTYRFEYGVFLLNKDIEMLMADRDLRALDMRHTLPNLKNLLLTLTDGEGARLTTSRVLNPPTCCASNLELPRAKSPPTLALVPCSPSDTNVPRQVETDGNTSSGATTPTTSINDRKSKSLLGLYPLAGFLRTRYPSVVGRPSVKSVAEIPEGGFENGDAPALAHTSLIGVELEGTPDDDEDRRTIRAVDVDDEEGKQAANGHGMSDGARRPIEKALHQIECTTQLPTPTPSTIVSNVG